MSRLTAALLAFVLLVPAMPAAQDEPRPTFRAAVNRVSLSVSVRSSRGRLVGNLKPEDFRIYDGGVLRPIAEFRAEATPINIAFLVDQSGSMGVASRRAAAREQVRLLLERLTPAVDQAALYTFDRELRELQTMAPAPGTILAHLDSATRPYGVTSLFDAIAAAGREAASHSGARRAVVAITDGLDNASQLTPEVVSAIASSIDVPVYIVLVVSPFDQAGRSTLDDGRAIGSLVNGPLGNLARWTGGDIYAGIGLEPSARAAQELVTELRQQYVIAFEPGPQPGWHPLEVRTRDDRHVVRTRSGYIVGNERGGV